MATQIVAPQAANARAASSDQTIAAGAVHTLLPKTTLGGWKVEIQAKNAANQYTRIGQLSGDPGSEQVKQLAGPLVYRVAARGCGVDAETGS